MKPRIFTAHRNLRRADYQRNCRARWAIFGLILLILCGFLIYRLATAEHRPAPANPMQPLQFRGTVPELRQVSFTTDVFA